jgi:hypothetical protein
MATPHVTGAAALFLEENPTATPAVVVSSILRLATTGVVADAGAGTPNRLLAVTVPQSVIVPDVTGMTCASAVSQLRAVGLAPHCVGTGKWVATEVPFPGTAVPPGTSVSLGLTTIEP